MPTRIKICGLSTAETVEVAIDAGATHLGFVHFAASPRHLELEVIARLTDHVAARACTVLLLVDPDDALIARVLDTAGAIDTIQLHGKESPARAAAIRDRSGCAVWKVLPVGSATDLAASADYPSCDRILYDARPPAGAPIPGGLGRRFDWSILAGHAHPPRWGLAGGLDPGNVAEALRRTGAPLVDVSSGVESAPGVKDVDKIARFCQAVRDHDHHHAPR